MRPARSRASRTSQVIGHCREGGLLDEHVLAGREGAECQVEVEARRYRHDHGIDIRRIDGRGIVGERRAPREFARYVSARARSRLAKLQVTSVRAPASADNGLW